MDENTAPNVLNRGKSSPAAPNRLRHQSHKKIVTLSIHLSGRKYLFSEKEEREGDSHNALQDPIAGILERVSALGQKEGNEMVFQ